MHRAIVASLILSLGVSFPEQGRGPIPIPFLGWFPIDSSLRERPTASSHKTYLIEELSEPMHILKSEGCEHEICDKMLHQSRGLHNLKLLRNYVRDTVATLDQLVTALDAELITTGTHLRNSIGNSCSSAHTLLKNVVKTLSLIPGIIPKPLTPFQMAFVGVPKTFESDIIVGATPEESHPFVIRPLNFAPAVVAPSSVWLTRNLNRFPVRGAIPLFKPFDHFRGTKFEPIQATFYLAEPNLRKPHSPNTLVPSKISSPRPAFSPIRDTRVVRKPTKIPPIPSKEDPTAIPFQTRIKIVEDGRQVIRVAHFPSEIGGAELRGEDGSFPTRDNSELPPFSAPGGIAQSTQPFFTFETIEDSQTD